MNVLKFTKMKNDKTPTPSKDLLKDGEFDPEYFWKQHCRSFSGVNGGEYIDKEDYEKALHLSKYMSLSQTPIPSNGEKMYRWVKGELPDERDLYICEIHIKNNGHHSIRVAQLEYFKGFPTFNGLYEGEWVECWLQEIPAPLNQPGIDREETNGLCWICKDIHTERRNTSGQWECLNCTSEDNPVSAVNAPAEIPEEIFQWIDDNCGCAKSAKDPFYWRYREAAIAMYRKLQEDIKGKDLEILSGSVVIDMLVEDKKALQASLSSIKGEKENAEKVLLDRIVKLCDSRDRIGERLHDLQDLHNSELIRLGTERDTAIADRDLYRKESEDLRKALDLANEDRAGKNVRIAEMEEEIAEYREALKPGTAIIVHQELLNKYPKKEEENNG